MKITYKFANGETAELEVSSEWGDIVLDLDRQEYNANHRETRRHASLEAFNLDDALFPSDEDVAGEVERRERDSAVKRAISQLLPAQQKLIRQIFFEGVSATEIARRDGVDKSAISHRLDRALKKLKKLL